MTERASTDGKLQPGAPNDPVPFGKYYLLGLIARGGMAEVYRARLRPGETDNSVLSASTAKRLLAIKVMRPQLAREAHDWTLTPKRSQANFAYYARRALARHPDALSH